MRALASVVFSILTIAFIGSCCTTEVVEYPTQIWVPVYKNLDEIRNGVKAGTARALKNPGKIYFYGKYILVNERNEGIHVIDNTNPRMPKNLSFIEIPGNGDMAVRNNILFANSYIDLVALDISNPSSPTVVKRIEGIFPMLTDGLWGGAETKEGMVVEYVLKDTVYKYYYEDCGKGPLNHDYPVGNREFGNGDISMDNSKGNPSQTGKGGSMARFTIYDKYLYSVDMTSLQLFDISTPRDPKVWSKVSIGWEIETIFPFRDKLFIGSTTGMFIYDVSDAAHPKQLGQFSHARGCDPVVANDKYAYVTLRTGTRCVGNLNQLDVLDISDLTNPKLIKTYPMQEPAGLGLDNNILFLCDGPAGLKVYDVANPAEIKLLDWQSDIKTFDVIPLGSSLLMIGEDGLFQYDYTDPKNLILLSKIPIVK
ncbi:MAG: hypothetical protein M9949_06645 [Candidatus Kapabacteria bacterium]|nr:hypothetical protein [Candidatus Kapabacteria bacterium]